MSDTTTQPAPFQIGQMVYATRYQMLRLPNPIIVHGRIVRKHTPAIPSPLNAYVISDETRGETIFLEEEIFTSQSKLEVAIESFCIQAKRDASNAIDRECANALLVAGKLR